MSSDLNYFFASGNEQRGPYALEDFVALGLRPDTLVWREGLAKWERLDALPEVMERMAIAQPAPVGPTPSAPALPALMINSPPLPIAPLAYESPYSPQMQTASGMAVASLVLGIIGMLSFCGFSLAVLGVPCSILAIIFGFLGRGKALRGEAGGRGMATAGIILGCIHLGIITIILLVLLAVALVAMMH